MCASPAGKTTTFTFVVRFWRESIGAQARWRGRIEHVQSGEEASFLAASGLLQFLERFGIYAQAGAGRWAIPESPAVSDNLAGSGASSMRITGGVQLSNEEAVAVFEERFEDTMKSEAALDIMLAYRSYRELVASGMDPDEALLRAFLGIYHAAWQLPRPRPGCPDFIATVGGLQAALREARAHFLTLAKEAESDLAFLQAKQPPK